MLHRIENGVSKYQFDSLGEVSRWITDERKRWTYNTSHDNGASKSWDLGAGYDEAVRMAREGWLEGAERAAEHLKALTPKEPAPALRTDFYGHMPHVPRFCAGAPDNMIRHHPTPTLGNGRVLTLYVPINANYHTKAAYMANFGIGLAHYVDQLEQDGIRVELYATQSNDGFNKHNGAAARVNFAWLLKHADQPVDLAVLAFAVGHPAMFRRLGFAMLERSDVAQLSSYGCSADAALSDFIDPPAGAYVLNGMCEANYCAQTPAQASEYIAKQIELAIDTPDAGAGKEYI